MAPEHGTPARISTDAAECQVDQYRWPLIGVASGNLYCSHRKHEGYNGDVDPTFLYERLADELADMVAKGALRPGERLPSVRRLAEERGVSVATVLSTYVLLEGRGLVETRPKSGHFVRARR